MARYNKPHKKQKLAKEGKHTDWMPIWCVAKIEGKNARTHPGRYTTIKRHWSRDDTDV
jgi:ribosomal protein L39E